MSRPPWPPPPPPLSCSAGPAEDQLVMLLLQQLVCCISPILINFLSGFTLKLVPSAIRSVALVCLKWNKAIFSKISSSKFLKYPWAEDVFIQLPAWAVANSNKGRLSPRSATLGTDVERPARSASANRLRLNADWGCCSRRFKPSFCALTAHPRRKFKGNFCWKMLELTTMSLHWGWWIYENVHTTAQSFYYEKKTDFPSKRISLWSHQT